MYPFAIVILIALFVCLSAVAEVASQRGWQAERDKAYEEYQQRLSLAGGWHDGEAAEPAELKLLALASRAGELSALVNHTMEQISQRELRRGDLLLGAEPRRAESEALDRELGNEIDIKDCSSSLNGAKIVGLIPIPKESGDTSVSPAALARPQSDRNGMVL